MNKEQVEAHLGKAVGEGIVFFHSPEAFRSHQLATTFCREQGLSVGRMCGDLPIGVKAGDWDIQKWRNLDKADMTQLDGALVGDQREGPVTLFLGADWWLKNASGPRPGAKTPSLEEAQFALDEFIRYCGGEIPKWDGDLMKTYAGLASQVEAAK